MQSIICVSGGAISSENSFDFHDGKSSVRFYFAVLMRRRCDLTRPTIDRGLSVAEKCGCAILEFGPRKLLYWFCVSRR